MTDERYARLAAELLPADLAERWTALLRPCVRLRRAAEGDPVVAALGGQPELPDGVEWPEWPGHGPLSFVASVRCAALPREGVTPGFPADGTLLFFHFDGQADGDADSDGPAGPDGPDGPDESVAQVLYIPDDTPLFPVTVPQESTPYPRTDLAADTEQSAPDLWLPQVRDVLLGDGGLWPHPRETPAELRSFSRAFARLRNRIGHQIGGHAIPVQGPVEYEIAGGELGDPLPWGDPRLDREAERWVLLAQFDSDSDAEMTWGDTGTLYWLIRPEDLAAHRFGRARLVVQC